ncbi:MAG: hypothetical protein HYU78_06160 [Rhodocyclales bacterium]|nr:hypothetical protein [Rhodocyclales bacterium]
MRHRIRLLLLAMPAAAGAQDITLPGALTVGWINAPDVAAQISYCAANVTPEKIEDIKKRVKTGTVVIFDRNSPKSPYLLATGDKVACIDRNGDGRPILPPNTFAKLVKFDGASEQTSEAIYRSLATQLAQRGSSEALVKFSNGNAVEINLSVVEDAPMEIQYTTNFMKAGQFDETKYRFVASDQIKSFTATSYGTSGRRAMNILQDELAPRPLKGNFLLAQGNSQTREYAFEGTTWRFSSGSSISLSANRELSFKPKQGEAQTGSWQVDDGALYFSYGKVFGSATLETDEKLSVEFRTDGTTPTKGERRWAAKLERSLF